MINYGYAAICILSGLCLTVLLHRWERASSLFVPFIYSLVCAITLGRISQGLYPSYVLILTLVIFAGTIFWLKLPGLTPVCRNGWCLFLVVLVYLSFFSFQALEGFLGSQDGRASYLPMSRILSHEPNLPPGWFYETLPNFSSYVGYPPLLIGMGALIFNLSGVSAQEIAAVIPAVFLIGFLMLLLCWCEEEGVALIIPAGLLLLSPFFVERLSWFCYEGPLVFSTTLLAYTAWKFSKERDEKYLAYAMIGSAMALMSKYTGLLFTLVLVFFILKWRGLDKKIWGTFLLIHLVPALWYLRNVYYFGSPVPPFLNSLIQDPQFKTGCEGFWLLGHEEAHIAGHKWLTTLALNTISIPLLFLWATVFPFTPFKQNIVYRVTHIIFCIVFFLWLYFNPDMRYIMPFYGVALTNLSVLAHEGLKQKVPKLLSLTPLSKGVVAGLFLASLCGQYVYTTYILPDHISSELNATSFLSQKEHAGPGTRIFTDTDHILAWQAGWVVFEPSSPRIAPDFLVAREKKDFYSLMRKYRIQYVVNHPWKSPWEESIFSLIGKDTQHFREIYGDATGVKGWKVIYE